MPSAVGLSGRDGAVYATMTGGLRWKSQSSGTSNALAGVAFADASRGWLVGQEERKVIRKTTDGGAHWRKQSAGTKATFWAVSCVDAKRCWVAGASGLICRTTDGGAHWRAQTSKAPDDLNAIHFFDASHGCAIGNAGYPVVTRNGGRAWTPRGSNLTYDNLNGVCFVDDLHGWAVGGDQAGKMTVTSDGGASWLPQAVPPGRFLCYPSRSPTRSTAGLSAGTALSSRRATAGVPGVRSPPTWGAIYMACRSATPVTAGRSAEM